MGDAGNCVTMYPFNTAPYRPDRTSQSGSLARRSRTGFTLLEVIVVIAIIAVLIGMIVPAVARARVIAKQLKCATELRQIGQAVAMYRDDNNDQAPFLGEIPNKDAKYIVPTPEQSLGSYLENDWKVFLCPADDEPRRKDWYVWRADSGQPKPWPDTAGVPEDISYMWSEQLLRGYYPRYPYGKPIGGGFPAEWQRIRWSSVKNPQKWGILSEGSHIFNGWKWRTLDPRFSDCRLDQTHGKVNKVPQVNMLFGTGDVVLIPCDARSLEKVWSDADNLNGGD